MSLIELIDSFCATFQSEVMCMKKGKKKKGLALPACQCSSSSTLLLSNQA